MRILLAGMSTMLSNIVSAVIEQLPDSTVAGRVEDRALLLVEVGLVNADVVMLQDPHPEAAQSFLTLLRSFPTVRVVAITDDGSSGYLHEMRLTSAHLPELSACVLQAALSGEWARMLN